MGDIAELEASGVDVVRLQSLWQSSGTARMILDDFASRDRKLSQTTIDATLVNLSRRGTPVGRPEAIDVFRKLADAGCGVFKTGRKGAKTRLEWTVDLRSVGRSSASKQSSTSSSGSPGEVDTQSELMSYPFPLRADLTVSLYLPKDLRSSEADRLAEFLKAIALPENERTRK